MQIITAENRQATYIRGLELAFFQEFGRRIRIEIKEEELSRSLRDHLMGDKDQKKLLSFLNAHIPTTGIFRAIFSIVNRCRKREIVELRMIYCKLLREELGLGLEKISSKIKRDHSTVLYNIHMANDLLDSNSRFQYLYEKIISNLKEMYEGVNGVTKEVWNEPKSDNAIALYEPRYKNRRINKLSSDRRGNTPERRLAGLRAQVTVKVPSCTVRGGEIIY